MKGLAVLWVVLVAGLGAQAGSPSRGAYGYRRSRMDWSHLTARPAAGETASALKRASLSGKAESESYPRKYDLRTIGAVTPVKNQGPFGCCWSFAACGSLESRLARLWGAEYDFSERNLALFYGADADPDIDEHGFGLIDMGGDTSLADAYFLRWAGPVLESDDPYPPESSPAFEELKLRYGGFFSNTLSQVCISGEPYFVEPSLDVEFLAGLDSDDWTVIDRAANQEGLGANFHTNFVHNGFCLDERGRRISVPHVNRNLLAESVFADCPDRQGPWEVPVHVQGCWRLPPRANSLDNATYKFALVNAGAVSVAYCHDADFRSVSTNEDEVCVGYYCPEKGVQPNHQVLLIGWDDDYPAERFAVTPPGDGAFLVKNNWGVEDDAGGYFWISYYDTGLARASGDVASVYTRVDDPLAAENYDYIHSYDTLGLSGSKGCGKTSATAANVFTANQAEMIRAVGTYLLQWNTKYTVKIYTGCAADRPTSGVLVHSQTGTREFPGYETIDLDQAVPVVAGERYSVVVTLTTPGFKRPIPLQLDDTARFRCSKRKRSYFLDANGTWKDLYSEYQPKKALSAANCPKTFCCKAYGDARLTTSFDGDAKGIYTYALTDGSVLTVTVGAASGGACQVSATIVKRGKKVATYPARKMLVKDGLVILKSSSGKNLQLKLSGCEDTGNEMSARLGGVELGAMRSVNPNLTNYLTGPFRVGVAVSGEPVFENWTGKAVTWSAKNLPAGVKINSKTGCLSGAPTVAVKTAKTARVTVSVAGGGSDSFAFCYTVDPLDGWAKGTKTGGGDASSFVLTVGKTGKVSGKLYLGNTNWTFSAACLTAHEQTPQGGLYRFEGTAKSGRRTLPIAVDLAPVVLTNCTADIPFVTIGQAVGRTDDGTGFIAQANVWAIRPYADYAKVLSSAPIMKLRAADLPGLGEKESLSLKFGKSGKVIVAASFSAVKNKRATYYRPSLSTLLCPASTQDDGAFRAQVFPWFAPKTAYRFKGFATRLSLIWDDFRFLLLQTP